MTFEGALVSEQGITFAVVVIKPHIVQSHFEATQAIRSFQPAFPGVPVVLMGQDYRGTATYFGRRDIADFLAGVPIESIPWKRFSIG